MGRPKKFNTKQTLERAMNLFWKKGFHATTMADLVTHLELQRGSIYDTFGNKERLFRDCLEHYHRQSLKRMRKLLSEDSSPDKRLYLLLEWVVQDSLFDWENKGCFTVNTCVEMAPHEQFVQDIVEDHRIQVQDMVERLVIESRNEKDAVYTENTRSLALSFMTAIQGIRVMSRSMADKESLKLVIRPLMRILQPI